MSSGLKPWSAPGKSWFLGIGIDNYISFQPLHNAVRDMHDICKVLEEKYDIIDENTVTLINDEATEVRIIIELESLADIVGEQDKLLIYYSGHGFLNRGTNLAYWIPVDARQGNSADYIPNSTIRDHLSAIRAKHILLISDSCFSGSLFIRGGLRSGRAVEELETTPSRWALCSGRGDEEVEDGMAGTNSPFAVSVLESLRENKDPAWNVSRLVERVREQTAAVARQVPEGNPLRLEGHKGGQYVFRLKSEAALNENAEIKIQGAANNQYDNRSQAESQSSNLSSRGGLTTGHKITKSSKNKLPSKSLRRTFVIIISSIIITIAGIIYWGSRININDVNIIVNSFHTTSSINENLWPADKEVRFEISQRVYVYGSLISEDETEIELQWKDSNGKIIDDQKLQILKSIEDPFRITAYKIFKNTGIYQVELTNNLGEIIKSSSFEIIENK